MSNQDLISMSQFLATLLPPDEQAQLDDENDKSLVKIPTLFFVATYLLSIYQTTGAAAALDKAIGYAQQLMTLLAALEHQPTHEPTAPTAAGLFMTLLEQKSNDSSDKHHYERLVEAAEDHLKLKQPQIPVHTQGTLAHALTQLYYRTYDSTILQRAIQETRDYLCIVETDHATATEEPVSNELLFGTRKNLVSCLAERHWSERDADSLCDLINECGRSLDLIPKQATEHGKVQEIMNFAVMAWYFRRLAPEWDMQGLFAESADDEVLDDEPKTSSESNTETLEQNFSSLSVSNNVYLDHVLHQGTKEIRILELLPGAQGSPLHCKLQVVDLQNHPEYNALSYVWGESKDAMEIRVDHSIFNVTTNLFRALSRFRRRSESLVLWVDAICINQNDDVEKLHQIDLMRDVYSSAREVMMWLGEPNAGDTTRPQKIRAHPETLEEMKDRWPAWIYDAVKPYLDEEPEDDPPESRLGDDLRFREVIDQLPHGMRPTFHTPKVPQAYLGDMDRNNEESRTLVITTLFNETANAINDFADLLQQNRFSASQEGPKPDIFDWQQPSQVPRFFRGPLEPRDWPILGAFSIAYFLATSKHLTDMPFFGKGENIAYSLSQAWLKSVDALQSILNNTYWMRAWITQEIVLAQNPVIYYGQHIMSFKMLATAQQVLKQHSHARCCASALEERTLSPCYGTPIWTALTTSFSRIEDFTEMWLENSHSRALGGNIEIPWSHLLSFNLTRRYATKPVDHVYGVLGLVDNTGPDKIPADYSASVAAVYTQAVGRLIKSSLNLKFVATFNATRPNQHNLPSWVPDWSTGAFDTGIGYPWKPQTSDGNQPSVRIHDDLCLSVRSSFIDEVSIINPEMEDCTGTCHGLEHRVKLLSSWRETAGLTGDINKSSPRENEFWRTLFAGHMFNFHVLMDRRQMVPSDVERAGKWWQWIQAAAKSSNDKMSFGGMAFSQQPSLQGRDDEFDQMVHALTRRKTFFITKKGRLATARGPVANGDEIHLVEGSGFPLILRRARRISPRPSSSSPPMAAQPPAKESNHPNFLDLDQCAHDRSNVVRYIGDTYVHGITRAETQSNIRETVFVR